jgi:hypothetical protein
MLRRGGTPRTDAELYSVGATPHESKASTASQRGVLPHRATNAARKRLIRHAYVALCGKTHNLPSRLRPSRWIC